MSSPRTEAVAALPWRSGWREVAANLRSRPAHLLVIGGSLVMLVGSGLVSGVNFLYNVVVARLLGPVGFGHAAAAVTMLMLVSAVTLAFQLVCAKFIARNPSPGARAAVYSTLLRRAWLVGGLIGAGMALASGPLTEYLRLPSPWVVLLLAAGMAFYVPLGVRRGGMQGICAFPRLASNFVLEVVVKFFAAVLLIRLGYGVLGAVGAITASVIVAYFLPRMVPELRVRPESALPASFREGMQAIVFFVGMVVINNIDILLVKHLFTPLEAGLYAAVALVGRVLYFASWAVVSAMFPVSAGERAGERNLGVLVLPLLFVLGLSVLFISLLALFPGVIVSAVFGADFQEAKPLLSLYAATTGVYALAVVLMAYEISRKIANTAWLQLVFGGLLVLGISLFHSSLREVVIVQLVLMVALLIAVALPFFRTARTFRVQEQAP